MTSRRTPLRHIFDGGWSTDLSQRTLAGPDNVGLVRVPYLTRAENLVYEFDGGLRKAPGCTKVNTSALESGARINGFYDAWFQGSVGSPVQHRVIAIGEKIKADDADGVFADIITGLADGGQPSFCMLEDVLVIGITGGDPPQYYDGSTAGPLPGSPPNFTICCTHANRVWAAGDVANPSALYYSPLLDPKNTTGEGWGRINVDPSDGDRITAIASYKGELIVFKGPYKGSIHRIAGTAPTGSDGYRRTRWIERIGAASQNSLFFFNDDLGFVAFDATVRSLKATAAYGDFNEIALSRTIQKFLRRANFTRLSQVSVASGADVGFVLISLPIDGATTNNAVIGMDYRFADASGQGMRWFYWPAYEDLCECIADGIDPADSNKRIYFAGGNDGFVRRLLQEVRSIDTSTPIAMRASTPFFDYGDPFSKKTLGEGYLQFSPRNNGDIAFLVRRDGQAPQQYDINQSAGDPLGMVDGPNFTLNSSTLSESNVIEKFFEADQAGEFRQVQYEIQNSALGEDVEVHGFGVSAEPGGWSTEND